LKLRIKVMSRILKENYPIEKWPTALKRLLADWDEVGEMPIALGALVDNVTFECLNIGRNLDVINSATQGILNDNLRYDAEKHASDVERLVPLLLSLIPCGETGQLGMTKSIELPSIINAGWYVYLCEFEKFRSQLYEIDRKSRSASKRKLHELI